MAIPRHAHCLDSKVHNGLQRSTLSAPLTSVTSYPTTLPVIPLTSSPWSLLLLLTGNSHSFASWSLCCIYCFLIQECSYFGGPHGLFIHFLHVFTQMFLRPFHTILILPALFFTIIFHPRKRLEYTAFTSVKHCAHLNQKFCY